MVRSVWKGPFVEGSLLKKADAAPASGRHDVIKIWRRRSTTPPTHPAAVRRFGIRRLQRPEACAGIGQRGNGGPQVRRVLAAPDLPRPFWRQESQEGLRTER